MTRLPSPATTVAALAIALCAALPSTAFAQGATAGSTPARVRATITAAYADHLDVTEVKEDAPTRIGVNEGFPEDGIAVDIGPGTASFYATLVRQAKTVFWNGPMGIFEMPPFAGGTRKVAEALAACEGTTVVGGGDSIAALTQLGLIGEVTHASTGGGASLELIEGRDLPGVEALKQKA